MRRLYRTFCYGARPYSQKAHTAVEHLRLSTMPSQISLDSRTGAAPNALYNVPKLAVRRGEVRKDRNRSWTLNAEPQRDLLTGIRGARQLPGTSGGAWHQVVRDVPMDPHTDHGPYIMGPCADMSAQFRIRCPGRYGHGSPCRDTVPESAVSNRSQARVRTRSLVDGITQASLRLP